MVRRQWREQKNELLEKQKDSSNENFSLSEGGKKLKNDFSSGNINFQ